MGFMWPSEGILPKKSVHNNDHAMLPEYRVELHAFDEEFVHGAMLSSGSLAEHVLQY